MPAAINFPTIPPNLALPLFYADFDNSQAAANQDTQTALLIGQTITAAPAVPTWMTDYVQASAMFGAGSQIALMVAAYRAADPFGPLYVLPLADAGGSVAAAGSIAFAGSPTAAGVLALYIAGVAVPVALTAGMTAAQIATAVAAAINAVTVPTTLPVSAAVDGGVNTKVDITALNKGAVGNSIDLRLNYYGVKNNEVTPAGLTVTIVAMSGGATDPDLTGVDAILGGVEYDFIALAGYTGAAQLNAMQAFMAHRWAWDRGDYGHVWTAKMDADATGATNLAFGQTRNDPHMLCVSYEPSPMPPWAVATTFMAGDAVSLKVSPNRPTQFLALPGLLAPPISTRYSKATRQALLTSGLALMHYLADGTCQILRSVTTYQKNAAGGSDQSYMDVETLFNLMFITRFLKNAVLQTFPRARLAADGTNFGFTGNKLSETADIVTPNVIRLFLIAKYAELQDLGLVQDLKNFQANLVVQINAQNPSRLDVLFPPELIGGLRIFALLNQFRNTVPTATAA